MSHNPTSIDTSNLIVFPSRHLPILIEQKPKIQTPNTDEMALESERLNRLSSFQSTFDWEPIRALELRTIKNPVRGGFLFKSPFKLVNAHVTCQQCLYAFEIDTYGRGCVHNCVYCYAKEQLTLHGYWNNPFPVPADINAIRKVFYTVFETDKPTKWRKIVAQRIPIRIGSMSDSFMWLDDKLKVTKEFLKLLSHYKYPNLIFTRSDLVARDDYMSLLDRNLTSVQFSLSSVNDDMNKKLEPGAPSARRRLAAISKLNSNGIWTTVRLNPFFPTHPDGYYTNPDFSWDGEVPVFPFSSIEMIDEIAQAGTKSVLAGIVRLAPAALNNIEKASGINYRRFFTAGRTKSVKDYHYSDREIRYYYQKLKERCDLNNLEFTTCYIGNGEGNFWRDQDLWSNKIDCCNVKNRVSAFRKDSRQIPFEDRLKVSSTKGLANDPDNLHKTLGPMAALTLIHDKNDRAETLHE